MNLLDSFRFIDLTHPLCETVPTWGGGCGFHLAIQLDYLQGLRVQSIKSHAGVGTHIDAPSHFIEGAWNIGDIPIEQLVAPLCVLDLRRNKNPDFFVSIKEIQEFEIAHGKIPKKSLVLANTGWGSFWNDPHRYRNPDLAGKMHFPGFSAEAASLLLKREIVGLGIDTLSPDGSQNGPGSDYPVHRLVLGAQKYILENVANLDQMPPLGAFAIALPPRARDATESAARLVGLIPR